MVLSWCVLTGLRAPWLLWGGIAIYIVAALMHLHLSLLMLSFHLLRTRYPPICSSGKQALGARLRPGNPAPELAPPAAIYWSPSVSTISPPSSLVFVRCDNPLFCCVLCFGSLVMSKQRRNLHSAREKRWPFKDMAIAGLLQPKRDRFGLS